jgi:hypothetical protein
MKNPGLCCKCKCEMWIPDALYEAAQSARGVISFYCAYGHAQVFAVGETEETKLRRERDRIRRERDRLKQREAMLEEEARLARERADKAEAATKRLKKKAAVGNCPCCKRTFTNMARHMQTKHPEFRAEAVNVVPLRA